MARTSEDSDTVNEACLIYKKAGSSGGGGGAVFPEAHKATRSPISTLTPVSWDQPLHRSRGSRRIEGWMVDLRRRGVFSFSTVESLLFTFPPQRRQQK